MNEIIRRIKDGLCGYGVINIMIVVEGVRRGAGTCSHGVWLLFCFYFTRYYDFIIISIYTQFTNSI